MHHTVLLPFQPYLNNELEFSKMREKILGQPKTGPQSASTELIKSVNDSHQPNASQSTQQNHKVLSENSATKLEDRFFIHYTHEGRFHSMKRDLHSSTNKLSQTHPSRKYGLSLATEITEIADTNSFENDRAVHYYEMHQLTGPTSTDSKQRLLHHMNPDQSNQHPTRQQRKP